MTSERSMEEFVFTQNYWKSYSIYLLDSFCFGSCKFYSVLVDSIYR